MGSAFLSLRSKVENCKLKFCLYKWSSQSWHHV